MKDNFESRKQKQQFLKESIIEQGIPVKHFEEFLCTLKDEPFDIDSYTSGELARIVEMFKRFEGESKINELMASTTMLNPDKKIQCEPLEYIEVSRFTNKRIE